MSKSTLSKYDYVQSLEAAARGYEFYGLLGALMRQADTENLGKLRRCFPGIWESLLEWRDTPIWPLGGGHD